MSYETIALDPALAVRVRPGFRRSQNRGAAFPLGRYSEARRDRLGGNSIKDTTGLAHVLAQRRGFRQSYDNPMDAARRSQSGRTALARSRKTSHPGRGHEFYHLRLSRRNRANRAVAIVEGFAVRPARFKGQCFLAGVSGDLRHGSRGVGKDLADREHQQLFI